MKVDIRQIAAEERYKPRRCKKSAASYLPANAQFRFYPVKHTLASDSVGPHVKTHVNSARLLGRTVVQDNLRCQIDHSDSPYLFMRLCQEYHNKIERRGKISWRTVDKKPIHAHALALALLLRACTN